MIIGTTFALFFILFLFQIILARLIKPLNEDKSIILLYVALPMLLFAGGCLFHFFGRVSLREAVLIYLLFFVISSSWVASYPAIYANCPTLIISWVIVRNSHGATVEELQDLLSLKQNSTERINDAVHDKLIRKNGEKVEITLRGRVVFLFFKFYRKALGLNTDAL